ncbi:MAG: hypothetical protein ACK5N8_02990 [Alphaproteobacteria bacterium]
MSKIVLKIMVASLFLLLCSFNASAKIYAVDDDAAMAALESSHAIVIKDCSVLGYHKTSCPSGRVPAKRCPYNSAYFTYCDCDRTVYKYSEKNCDLTKDELTGKSCLYAGKLRYTACTAIVVK